MGISDTVPREKDKQMQLKAVANDANSNSGMNLRKSIKLKSE